MKKTEFETFLKEEKIKNTSIKENIKQIHDFESYIGVDLDSYMSYGLLHKKVNAYCKAKKILKENKDAFLNNLRNYGLAIKYKRLVYGVNKINGISVWQLKLEDTLAGYVGSEVATNILEAGGKIKSTDSADKKSAWSKCMIDSLEENLDADTCNKVLSNNLYDLPRHFPRFVKLKKIYEKAGNIDSVLIHRHEKWKKITGDQYGYDSAEYKFVENDKTIGAGTRKENIIYSSQIPFQLTEYVNEKDSKKKSYYYCHCPWVRESILKPDDERVSSTFCNCSAGFCKLSFKAIYDTTLEVEVVKSVLKGDEICTFAIKIPEDIKIDR